MEDPTKKKNSKLEFLEKFENFDYTLRIFKLIILDLLTKSLEEEKKVNLELIQYILKAPSLKKDNIHKAKENSKDYFYSILLTYADVIKKYDEDKKGKIIEVISKLILNSTFILRHLFVKFKENIKEQVSHYTSFDITKDQLLNNESKFRLNLANFMNDPTEGKVLSDFLGFTNTDINTIEYAFLASFSLNINNLNLFRLYGKKDNIEGTGLSLVIKNNFFSQNNNSNALFDKEFVRNKTNVIELFMNMKKKMNIIVFLINQMTKKRLILN